MTTDAEGNPIETLRWTPEGAKPGAKETDTPHPIDEDGEALTAELLWVAQSHSGDYHDNMTSENYLRWVSNRLLPTFKQLYGENMQMILVQDNAPYHHKRGIGTLPSGKGKLWAHFKQVCPEVKTITLPISSRRTEELTVTLTDELVAMKASKSRPNVPDEEELREGVLAELRKSNSPLLQCKVENMLREAGHRWIWTPPYCPWLQPVRLPNPHAAHFHLSQRAIAADRDVLGRGQKLGRVALQERTHDAHCHRAAPGSVVWCRGWQRGRRRRAKACEDQGKLQRVSE